MQAYGAVPPEIAAENVRGPPASAPADDGTTLTFNEGLTTTTAGAEVTTSPAVSRNVATGKLTPGPVGRHDTTEEEVARHPTGRPDQANV